MKFALVIMLVLGSSAAMAHKVNDFNQALIKDVKEAIATDNDQELKTVNSRAPASTAAAEDTDPAIKEDLKVNTKDKQIGNGNKW